MHGNLTHHFIDLRFSIFHCLRWHCPSIWVSRAHVGSTNARAAAPRHPAIGMVSTSSAFSPNLLSPGMILRLMKREGPSCQANFAYPFRLFHQLSLSDTSRDQRGIDALALVISPATQPCRVPLRWLHFLRLNRTSHSMRQRSGPNVWRFAVLTNRWPHIDGHVYASRR
jgi:hypothetical protein